MRYLPFDKKIPPLKLSKMQERTTVDDRDGKDDRGKVRLGGIPLSFQRN